MTFVFISHAQPDKTRPDQRMRALVGFLHKAGIPLWIDRPDELGLSAKELEERGVSLNGRWPGDIRDALNACATGVGFWSLHARTRVQQDAGGVLAQELQTLSLAGKLHLTCIDPGIVNDIGVAFKHLTQGQQAIDLGAVDPQVFADRAVRLIESLGAATGVKPARWRPYTKAISEQGRLGAFGGFLRPELRRAREGAAALVSAFGRHDPGRLAINLTPELAAAYERIAGECRRLNQRFRTYHRLLALMSLPSRHLPACLDEAEPGLGARVEAWLVKHAETGSEAYLANDPLADRHADAARAFAEIDQASAIDERHALQAILAEVGSGTTKALRKWIGEDAFAVLVRTVERRRPKQPDFAVSGTLRDLDA